jgi:hypothetical protein
LNPSDYFKIGAASGAIRTTGKPFDREERVFLKISNLLCLCQKIECEQEKMRLQNFGHMYNAMVKILNDERKSCLNKKCDWTMKSRKECSPQYWGWPAKSKV